MSAAGETASAPSPAVPAGKLAYTVREACIALGMGRTLMYERLHAGRIRAKREGNKILIPAEALKAYLDSLQDWTPSNTEKNHD
jgi:excisionase family DNA binding protein